MIFGGFEEEVYEYEGRTWMCRNKKKYRKGG